MAILVKGFVNCMVCGCWMLKKEGPKWCMDVVFSLGT
jgi:hypothetical protein